MVLIIKPNFYKSLKCEERLDKHKYRETEINLTIEVTPFQA